MNRNEALVFSCYHHSADAPRDDFDYQRITYICVLNTASEACLRTIVVSIKQAHGTNAVILLSVKEVFVLGFSTGTD